MFTFKSWQSNRLFPVFVQIGYVFLILIVMVAGGSFLINKIQTVQRAIVEADDKNRTLIAKRDYLVSFPFETSVLVRKMAIAYPSSEATFVAVESFKSQMGGVLLDSLTVSTDEKEQTVTLAVKLTGDPVTILDLVAQNIENYPICDLVSFRYNEQDGFYEVGLKYYQNVLSGEKVAFVPLSKDEEAVVKKVISLSTSSLGSQGGGPAVYTRDNPF